ncbi:MAG: efflux RND transporter periplasmic adaptor subunit, partial [Pirellulaceae bacterium]
MINEPQATPAVVQAADQQWLAMSPCLRKELGVDLRRHKDSLVAVIEDPVRSKFFQIGVTEYHFITLLDGQRTVQQIIEDMQSERGYEDFGEPAAQAIISWLSSMNLLDAALNTQRLCQAAQAVENQRLMGLLNPVSFRVNLVNPNKTLQKITPWLGWVFTPLALLAWLVTSVVAWILISSDYQRFCDAAVGILAPERWLWLLIVWVVLKIIHETAHGVACQKYGGDVPQAGLLILLLAPLAFVNVTSSWRFASRFKRMVVSAAGMYLELFVAFIAVIVWANTGSEWLSDLCYNVVVMAGISTVLFNANPLIRFDGYYLLADSLGVVNLYGKGQNWFGNRLRHFVFGFPLDTNICPPSEIRVVAAYGICAFVWRIILSVSLLLVASTLLGGFGLVLAAVGGVFWIWMPLAMNFRKIRTAAATDPIDKRRLTLVSTGFVLLVLTCFCWLRAPATTRAPALVQFKDEQILRAATDGFVRQIHVADGERVDEGAVLLSLENPELLQELESLKRSAESAAIQARIHRNRKEISLQQAELAKLQSINEQIREKQAQVDQLILVAPFDGMVFSRELEHMKGAFVHQGDVLMHFADPGQKQILVSIGQQEIEAVKAQPDRPVRIVFAGA